MSFDIRGGGWRSDCPKCVASKFACDTHRRSDDGFDRVPARRFYEGGGGWKDGRFGQAYDLIAEALKERGAHMYRHRLLSLIEEEDGNALS